MLYEEVFRVFHHFLNLTLVNSTISACLEYLLHAGFLLLFVPNGTTFACACLHMSITITLLSKRLATMIAWKWLRSAMDTDMVKHIANFEKLAATNSTYEDLIWAPSEAIVTKNFSKPSFSIFFTNIKHLVIILDIVLFKLLWGLIVWLEAIWGYNQVLNSYILMNHVLAWVSIPIRWNLCFHVHRNRHLNPLDPLVLLQHRWCLV